MRIPNLATPMIQIFQSPEAVEILEFQGEFENLELFDGVFDSQTLQMKFSRFSLQGRRVEKEFIVFEKNGNIFNEKAIVNQVILFDSPPKYNF